MLGARGRSWGGRDSHGAGGNSAGADQVKQVLSFIVGEEELRDPDLVPGGPDQIERRREEVSVVDRPGLAQIDHRGRGVDP